MKTINLFVTHRKTTDNMKDQEKQKDLLKKQCNELDELCEEVYINLFVACPKKTSTLREQKEFIKKQCLELNKDNANAFYKESAEQLNKDLEKEKRKVKIKPVTYDDPERREEVSKEIIKHRADIVVFLFDKDYDKCLLDELKLAVEQSIKFHKPEPVVFIKEDIKEIVDNQNDDNGNIKDNDVENNTDSNIIATNGNDTNNNINCADNNKINDSNKNDKKDDYEEIRTILAEGGWIYEPFKDTKDLWEKIKDKINRYVHSYNSIRDIQRWNKRRYYGFWIGLPLFIVSVILGVVFLIKWRNAESRRLLIVGGGSARQYIEDSLLRREIGTNYLNWYAAMPSGESYRIIAEERIKNYKGKSYKYRPYYPIVISAQMASEKNFLGTSTPKEFRKTGIIIGIHLTDDWLVAYGSEKVFDSIKHYSAKIPASALDSLIFFNIQDSTSSKIDIYTTSVNSGTLNTYLHYCDNLRKRDSLSIPNSFGFSNKDLLPKEENHNNKWIALGSFYYHPKNQGMEQLDVVSSSDLGKITKPIYVYFMLYKDHNSYILPKATNKFLKRIKIDRKKLEKITIIDEKNMNIIYNDTTRVLYDYDSIFILPKIQ